MKLKIANKEYDFKASLWAVMELSKSYDFLKTDDMTPNEVNKMIADIFWKFICRRWYGLKPYITLKRFMKAVSLADVKIMGEQLGKLLSGEDKETGN